MPIVELQSNALRERQAFSGSTVGGLALHRARLNVRHGASFRSIGSYSLGFTGRPKSLCEIQGLTSSYSRSPSLVGAFPRFELA
jgi:hypothetical protein